MAFVKLYENLLLGLSNLPFSPVSWNQSQDSASITVACLRRPSLFSAAATLPLITRYKEGTYKRPDPSVFLKPILKRLDPAEKEKKRKYKTKKATTK